MAVPLYEDFFFFYNLKGKGNDFVYVLVCECTAFHKRGNNSVNPFIFYMFFFLCKKKKKEKKNAQFNFSVDDYC